MTYPDHLKGLYGITQPHPAGFEALRSQVSAALRGGAALIQYRDKQSGTTRRIREAGILLELCHAHAARLIINDDIHLAKAIRADGVHLGRDDGDIRAAREQLGNDAIIGISCYNQLPLAIAAQAAGANYVAFGRFYPSRSKPEAIQAEPELLTTARNQLQLPVVAIGGITPENGATLIQAGADMLAVIEGIFGHPDIEARCRRYCQLFDRPESLSP